MFRASQLEEKPVLDLYGFLRKEKLLMDDPTDYYEETEFAGETNIVSLRVPKHIDERIRWIFDKVRKDRDLLGFSPEVIRMPISSGKLLRKMHKHGLMLLYDMEPVQNMMLVEEALKRFSFKLLDPTSTTYCKECVQLYNSVVGHLDYVGSTIQSILPYESNEYRKVSFRAYPKWKSKAKVLSGIMRTSEYTVNRLALVLSVATVVDIGISIKDVYRFLEDIAEDYIELVRPLDKIYVEITGQKLLEV